MGSALTMEKAVQNVVLDGFTVPNAIRAATKNPANLIGLKNKGELKEGYDADILVMDNKLNIMEVFLKGERINYL